MQPVHTCENATRSCSCIASCECYVQHLLKLVFSEAKPTRALSTWANIKLAF